MSVPGLRLQVYIDLLAYVHPGRGAANAAFPECVLDTGAYLSVIPEYVWGQFKPGVVLPLPFDPAMPAGQRSVSFGGGAYPYDLGELAVRLRDLSGGVMDVTVIAQFVRDGGRLTTPVALGLRGGVLDGRVLRSEPDVGAPFGQAWSLEDP